MRLFLITTAIASFVCFGWRVRFLSLLPLPVLLFGWCARLFLIITTFAILFLSGGVRGFLMTNSFTSFVVFSGGVLGYFLLLILSRVLFFRVACTVFSITDTTASFVCSGGVHSYF